MTNHLYQEAINETLSMFEDSYDNEEFTLDSVNDISKPDCEYTPSINAFERSESHTCASNELRRIESDSDSVNGSRRLDAKQGEANTPPQSVNGKILNPKELSRLHEMNKTYAHVKMGGKHKVASLNLSHGIGKEIYLENLHEFKNGFLSEEPIAGINPGSAWLKWKGKRFYLGGMNYYP